MSIQFLGPPVSLAASPYNTYAKISRQTDEKIEEYRRMYNLRDKDNVMVFTMPKGKTGKLCSFSYKAMTPRASTLKQNVYLLQGKITTAQNSGLPSKEKARRLASLRCQLKYANTVLAGEIDAIPTNAVIVDERAD